MQLTKYVRKFNNKSFDEDIIKLGNDFTVSSRQKSGR